MSKAAPVTGLRLFLVNGPVNEPGFRLRRIESQGRVQRYEVEPYATDKPAGQHY